MEDGLVISIIVVGDMFGGIITHAPVHINDFRGVRASYVKRTA